MSFKKGHKKVGGRKKGTTNKVTAELKEEIKSFLDGNFAKFKQNFELLDLDSQARIYLKLMEFVVPKQKHITQENYNFPENVTLEFHDHDKAPVTSEAEQKRKHGIKD